MVLPYSPLFNEKAADKAVMQSLHSEISRLREELQMSRVVKSVDGKYYVGEFEEVTADQVTEMIAHKQQQLAELEAIAPIAEPENQMQVEQPAAPAPAEQLAPVQPPVPPESPVNPEVQTQPEPPTLQ